VTQRKACAGRITDRNPYTVAAEARHTNAVLNASALPTMLL